MDLERHDDPQNPVAPLPEQNERERVIIELNAALERDFEELFETPEAA